MFLCQKWIMLTLAVVLVLLLTTSFDYHLDGKYSFIGKYKKISTDEPHVDFVKKEKEMQKRASNLAENCKKYKNKMNETLRDNKILVNDTYGYIYCLVPKTGCTTFKRILHTIGKPNMNPYNIAAINPKFHYMATLKSLSRYPQEEHSRKIANYQKIFFVREPISRLISAYWDKVYSVNPSFSWCQGYATLIAVRFRNATNPPECTCDITFKEFLQYITVRIKTLNSHYRPIYRVCYPCGKVPFNIIGHMDTYKEDIDYFLHKINVSADHSSYSATQQEKLWDIVEREVQILSRGRDLAIEKCGYTIKDLIMRTFNGLKQRGYIAQNAELRPLIHSDDYYTNDKILDLFSEAFHNFNGHRTTSAELRASMLKEIPDWLLDKIYGIYEMDYKLFGFEH